MAETRLLERLTASDLFSQAPSQLSRPIRDLRPYARWCRELMLAARLVEIVHELAHRHGGRPVKLLGDGVMFYFPDPAQAVWCGLELVDRLPQLGLPRARVGLHTGPVVFQNGDQRAL